VGKRINIAIDGPASSGKGTVARLVAGALQFTYIDTGAMYRGVALSAEQRGVSWTDEPGLQRLISSMDFSFRWRDGVLRASLDGADVTEALRREDIGKAASAVAIYPKVRAGLLCLQQEFGRDGGVVMDGRDIGSVVLPSAGLKIYLDASVEERAKRRTQELAEKGSVVDIEQVAREIVARDNQDSRRSIAPLIQTPDAHYMDTTGRTPAGIAAEVVQLAERLMAQLA